MLSRGLRNFRIDAPEIFLTLKRVRLNLVVLYAKPKKLLATIIGIHDETEIKAKILFFVSVCHDCGLLVI